MEWRSNVKCLKWTILFHDTLPNLVASLRAHVIVSWQFPTKQLMDTKKAIYDMMPASFRSSLKILQDLPLLASLSLIVHANLSIVKIISVRFLLTLYKKTLRMPIRDCIWRQTILETIANDLQLNGIYLEKPGLSEYLKLHRTYCSKVWSASLTPRIFVT